MTFEDRAYRRLDNLLTGLEDNILGLDDREVTSESTQLFGRIQGVRAVIDDNLEFRISTKDASLKNEVRRTRGRADKVRYEFPIMAVPNSMDDKRKLLEQLVAGRAGIPGQMRMAFSAPKTLSDSEVDSMMERLVRLGILGREGTIDDDT